MKHFILLITTLFLSYISFANSATPGLIDEWGASSIGLTNKIYIATDGGYKFSLALSTNGIITGWGDNKYGQSTPPEGTNYSAISAGTYHGLTLRNNGSIFAWGGQPQDIANGITNCPNGTNFIAVSAGGKFNVALKSDNSIVAWGDDDWGQITDIPQGYNFKAVAAGFAHAVALRYNGSIVVWGGFPDDYEALTNIPPGNDYISIDAGGSHCVAIHANGTPVAWGNNDWGQTDVPPTDPLFSIAAGESHNVAIRLDGTLLAWGANNRGQTNCPQGNTFTRTGAGSFHSLAINFSGLSAQILADKTIGLYTLPVQFLAGTSGTNAINIYYQWDFEDDGIIDIEGWGINTPTNLYTNGLYSVRLTVSNEENDTAYNFRQNYIRVMDQSVGADFQANILTGVIPFSVQFTDLSSNVPQYWLWDFDNNGSIDNTDPNPLHTYTSTGDFSVSLLVSNNFGFGSGSSFDSFTRHNYIIAVPAVSAYYSVDKTRVAIDETINFTDFSINGPDYWKWDFDNDGTIDSTNRNTTHAYSSSGYKTVTLICGNEFSVATNTKINLITITTTNHSLYVWEDGINVPPFDSWDNAATNIQEAIIFSMPGAKILISNGVYSSDGYPAEGTNVFAAEHNLTFTGCGEVTVDAKNMMRGCYIVSGELYRIKFINGKSENNGGNVFADNSSLISCLLVDGTAENGGGIFLTNNSKIYNCTIADNSATGKGGGAYSESQNEVWNSILYNNNSPEGSNYYFSSNVSLSYSCTLPEPAFGGTNNIYENPDFEANYIISDTSPCINRGYTFPWLIGQKDIYGNERVYSVNVDIGSCETFGDPVIADFSVNKTKAGVGDTINFTDLSTNNPTYWNWDFDDNGTTDSTVQNPSYAYSATGCKTVKLISGNPYSEGTNIKENLITVATTNFSLYVWENGSHSIPFNSWANAATNIQEAVIYSMPGAEILISNGVYSSEGYQAEGTNVFAADSARKFTGCGDVTVDGNNLMRGCYVVSSELYRIKFINGNSEQNGGNVFADNSSLISCLLVDGVAVNGGGIFITNNSKIYNCTIADNSATGKGGGAYSESQNEVWNSILYDNFAPNGSNYYFGGNVSLNFSCTLPPQASGSTNNVYENPEFINGYMINDISPCINAGYTFEWLESETDIVGSNRVNFGTVDIGAYETDIPEPVLFIIYYLSFAIYYIRKMSDGRVQ